MIGPSDRFGKFKDLVQQRRLLHSDSLPPGQAKNPFPHSQPARHIPVSEKTIAHFAREVQANESLVNLKRRQEIGFERSKK